MGVDNVTGATSTFLYFCQDMLVSGFIGENFAKLGIIGVVVIMGTLMAIGTAFRVRYNIQKSKAMATAAAQ
jgi:hypothetical protein